MIWNSASEFWAMGGYATYVWGSFGVCAVAFIAEPILLRARRAEIVRTLHRQALAQSMEKETN